MEKKRGRPEKHISLNDIEMIQYRFVNDMTYKEIGEHAGFTRQAAQQQIKRAVRKMASAVGE
jgi:predicted DNA-binding protein (UPF0251 family)